MAPDRSEIAYPRSAYASVKSELGELSGSAAAEITLENYPIIMCLDGSRRIRDASAERQGRTDLGVAARRRTPLERAGLPWAFDRVANPEGGVVFVPAGHSSLVRDKQSIQR
jgi:hypothetical protein